MANSQPRFKWTDYKFINLIKCLQELKSSMEFRNCNSNADKVKLYENVRESLNRYKSSLKSIYMYIYFFQLGIPN